MNDEDIIKQLLIMIGENPERTGLKDTPKRVVRMCKELFKGYNIKHKPELTVFPNNEDEIGYDEMIIDKGQFNTWCEHHILPVKGTYYFCYIPNKKVIGLSKVSRIINYYSSRLQVQERLVKQIIDELEKILKPKGIGLIMKANHMCKEIRGIKNVEEMITSDMRGVLRTKSEARIEFLTLINGGK